LPYFNQIGKCSSHNSNPTPDSTAEPEIDFEERKFDLKDTVFISHYDSFSIKKDNPE
jgi:hypothetical protein